jgi:hypothetical protein
VNTRSQSKRGGLELIAGTLVSVLLFALLLWTPLPHAITRLLSAYSIALFVIVLLIYYAGFRLPPHYRWHAAAGLTMILLGLSLSFLWHSGYSDDKIIGGLLPFRDGFDYFNGADWILSGSFIRNINEGAAWRPLYPGFLASLLWITGRNLQWAIALQVALAGLSFSLAACQVARKWGSAAAAVFATLIYFYIQPLIGTVYTETLGLALGCLGFVLILRAVERHGSMQLIAALAVLMLAVSVRAGAFFIFPLLILWAGWAWRGTRRFSARHAGLALLTVVLTYLALNTAYNKLTVEPGGFPFGNFAFTIYGQVNGGAGYHKAFEDLGVRNPAVILRAAERFFVAHPQGFAVGAAKAYRDFLSPLWGIFGFGLTSGDIALAILLCLLLLFGLYRLVRQWALPDSPLLLAGFIGILLSVPFLPPIDGGIRIYASTMPLIYVIPAIAVAALLRVETLPTGEPRLAPLTSLLAGLIGFLTVLTPIAVLYLTPRPLAVEPSCPAGQVPYHVVTSEGSYIDLVPNRAAACGAVPEVCLSDFQSYTRANDPSDAAVFNQLAAAAEGSTLGVFAGSNLADGRPHLFIGPASALPVGGRASISGCATESQVKGRPSIFTLQTIAPAP